MMETKGQPGPGAGVRAIYYGWTVVAAAFAVMFFGFGCAYSFSPFFEILQREFGASRGEVSLVFSLAGGLYFLLGAVSGPIADRLGPRWISAAGMLIIGLGLILASRATSLSQLYWSYGVGIGVGVGLSYVPSIGAVQRWFVRRRGFASGLAVSGIGLGTLCLPPLATWLIGLLDWRGAYLVLGLVAILGGGGAALFIENSPARRGLLPDGEIPSSAKAERHLRDEPAVGLDFGAALRSRPFLMLYAASVTLSLGLFIPFVHLVPYAEDHGMDKSTAVWLLSLIGVGSTVGRFALGSLADRLGRRLSLGITFFGMGTMLFWWSASTVFWQLALFALTFGAFYGGFVALVPALGMDFFGGRALSSILGVLYTSVALGTLVGPPLAGAAFDLSHSYSLPIAVSAASCFVGVLLIALLPDPATGRR